MKWRKVASIKFQAGTTFNLTTTYTRPRFDTLAISLGPHRTLRCGCGQTHVDRPDDVEIAAEVNTCVHIKALYGNGRAKIPGVPRGSSPTIFVVGKVRLTELGRTMFAWRHVAQAVE